MSAGQRTEQDRAVGLATAPGEGLLTSDPALPRVDPDFAHEVLDDLYANRRKPGC